jgi:cytoskeletal protein CcmA (bactofilin family)
MALFGKDRDQKEGARDWAAPLGPPPEAKRPPERVAAEVSMSDRERDTTQQPGGPGGTNAFLGKGSQITGKLVFEGTGRIEGQVEGEISAQATLTIGESAVVNARISGTHVIIHGRVTGDITARERLELRAPSRVTGNISAPSLVVHDGAFFEGQCSMRGSELATLGEKTGHSVLLHPEKRAETPAAKPATEQRPAGNHTAAAR